MILQYHQEQENELKVKFSQYKYKYLFQRIRPLSSIKLKCHSSQIRRNKNMKGRKASMLCLDNSIVCYNNYRIT